MGTDRFGQETLDTLGELANKVEELRRKHGDDTPVLNWVLFPNGNGIVPCRIRAGIGAARAIGVDEAGNPTTEKRTVYICSYVDKSLITTSIPDHGPVLGE